MSGYEKFQQIMAELKYKIEHKDNPASLPPGFEELFNNLRK